MQTKSTIKVSTAFGKGCGVLFFSVFAIMGAFFMFMICAALSKDWQTRGWSPQDAVLLGQTVQLEKSDSKNSESIPFRYTYEGRTYTRDTVTLLDGMVVNGHRSDSFRSLSNEPAGTKVTCFVNPKQPGEAVLEHRSLTYGWFLLLPGVFLLVGLGGMYFVIRAKSATAQAVSQRHKSATNPNCGILGLRLFAMVFILIGAFATWFIGVKPVLESREAAGWPQVPCKIKSASVSSHRGSKGGTTYGITVAYTYEYEGRKFSGDRYNFSTGTSSSRGWREEAVSQLRATKDPVCFVNPENPSQSVLSTEIGNEKWFGLIPLVFVLAGLGLFFAAPKMTARRVGARAIPIPPPNVVSLSQGGYELKPTSSPKAGCIGMGIFALFWNGIVWTVFFLHDVPGVAKAFLSIFLLVGIGLAVAFAYFFLTLFNPKPTVTVDVNAVRLGGTIKFRWRFEGNTARISLLEVFLTAKESATYRRGTDTSTDTHYFIHQKLHETRERLKIAADEITITIPADSMHSFDSTNNKIIWAVKLHGDIAKWPDVDLEFPLTVQP